MAASFIAAVVAPISRMRQKRRGIHEPELGSLVRRPLLPIIETDNIPESPGPTSSAATVVPRRKSPSSYGATDWPLHQSPVTLNRVPEDGAIDFDEDSTSSDDEEELLEERGLYKGSYRRLVLLYSLTPLTLLLVTVLLALLPTFVYYPNRTSPSPYPYLPYLPYPSPEILVAAGFWAISYLLRTPIYSLSVSLLSNLPDAFSILTSTTIQTAVATVLRLFTFPVLLIPHYMVYPIPTWHDLAFGRVWWSALGWAIAESVVAIKQGYDAIALYRDVLVTVRKSSRTDHSTHAAYGAGTFQTSEHSQTAPSSSTEHVLHDEEDSLLGSRPDLQLNLGDSLQVQIDRDFEQLIALKGREELEEIYGTPIIRIPVFISCLQRINSLLLALGLTLLLSAAYIRSVLSMPAPTPSPYPPMPPHNLLLLSTITNTVTHLKSDTSFKITLPVVFLAQLFLNILHTPLLLPRIGIHTVVYIGLLVALGSFFAGLGMWQALS